jgi:hypothetical protein
MSIKYGWAADSFLIFTAKFIRNIYFNIKFGFDKDLANKNKEKITQKCQNIAENLL